MTNCCREEDESVHTEIFPRVYSLATSITSVGIKSHPFTGVNNAGNWERSDRAAVFARGHASDASVTSAESSILQAFLP